MNLSGPHPNKITQLFNVAVNYFYDNPQSNYLELTNSIRFSKTCAEYSIKKLGGPMLGVITANSVKIWFRTVKIGSEILVVVKDKNGNIVAENSRKSINDDLSLVINIKGLQPNQNYYYQFFVDGQEVSDLKSEQKIRTAPLTNYKGIMSFAFGCDPHRWGLARAKLFDIIAKTSPTAMIMVGDVAVQDRDNKIGLHRLDLLLRDQQPVWQKFVAKIPIYTAWDDHDYFNNDKYGIPKGFTYQDKKAVWSVFRNNWVNPSYGFGPNGEGVFYKIRIGACEFFVLDNRYFRELGKKTLLGERQLSWLKENLKKSTAKFKLLVSPTMWSDYISNGKDSWGVYDKKGREELFTLIEKENISGVILLSGDRHGARGFKIPRKNGFNLYEFNIGSLGGCKGPKPMSKNCTTQLFGYHDVYAFTDLTVDTTKDEAEIVLKLINENGKIMYKIKLSERMLTLENNANKKKTY